MTGSAGNHAAAASIRLASMASRAAFRRRSATASHNASTPPTASAIAETRDGIVGGARHNGHFDIRRQHCTALGTGSRPPTGAECDHRDRQRRQRSRLQEPRHGDDDDERGESAARTPSGVPGEQSGKHEPDDPQRHRELDDDVVGIEDDRHPVVRGVIAHEVRRHVLLDRSSEAPEAPSERGTFLERRPPVAPDVEPAAGAAGGHATGGALATVADDVDEPDRDECAREVRDGQVPTAPPSSSCRDVEQHEHGRAECDARSGKVDGEREGPDEPEHDLRMSDGAAIGSRRGRRRLP